MPLTRTLAGRALSLRMRLTVTYVILVTMLLLVVGWFFNRILSSILYQRADALLEQQWDAVRGYLEIRNGRVAWSFHDDDPEETAIVGRLRQLIHIADDTGHTIDISDAYRALGAEPPEEVVAALRRTKPWLKTKRAPDGEAFRVLQGAMIEGSRRYFVSIGYPNADTKAIMDLFFKAYFTLVPVLVLLMGLLSWLAASRTLLPVNDLVRATQEISGRNLTMRLSPTGTGDELDILIRTFNGMLERLDQNFTQIRQFSIDASHELRTPLTGIRGQLEVALMSAKSTEQYRDAMITALQDVERLTQIVRSLLMLSQAESGQLVLQKADVNLSSAIHDLASQFELSTNEKGILLEREISPDCHAYVDHIQFDRLVSNLLSNAVRYSPAGGRVLVRLGSTNGRIELMVTDTGPGISEEHLPHIFERFYRVPGDQQDSDKGLGLGLSFVKWIVTAHGGAIHVASKVGKGTTFEVTLPIGELALNKDATAG